MRFTLTYDGPLKANGTCAEKHEIRKAFHQQLKTLWSQVPLEPYQGLYSGRKRISLRRPLGNYCFVPLVSEALYLVCEISIFMLRPEAPGSIITQGGDIDNRLKTLLDALRIPKTLNELPKKTDDANPNEPFFCLLEDDNLITAINVKTDRLLWPVTTLSQVHLDLQVETKATRVTADGNHTIGAVLG